MTARNRRPWKGDEGTDGTPPASSAGTAGATGNRGFRRESVTFESHGTRCAADLYVPEDGDPPWPTVVMAHVFGAERAWGLAAVAERFARAGLAAFVFDYRHIGDSEGTPRRLIDPDRQRDDWTAALEYVRSLDGVDDARIALWGSSFSGGHVLETVRREPDVRAVVAQVPFVDGRATVAHQTGDRSAVSRARTGARALADRLLAAIGLGPVALPIVSEPGGGGLVDSPGAKEGFEALVPEGEEPINRTPARVVLDLPSYRPALGADEIDVPVHVVVAEADRLLPREPTERLVDHLAAPSVHRVEAGHFDVHRDPWLDPVVEEQVAFLLDAMASGTAVE